MAKGEPLPVLVTPDLHYRNLTHRYEINKELVTDFLALWGKKENGE